MAQNNVGSSIWKSVFITSNNQRSTSQDDIASASSHSNNSAVHDFVIGDEPIALFRSELERLQHILHFPEELAFQLSATEYQLFYKMKPMDYVHYVSCDLTSVSVANNPSPIRNLVKRLSEISSWITHLIISMPTCEERRTTLVSIFRTIDVCWNIGNFNAAVEILMGLKSEKLRSFWLSLKPEEKKKYEQLCEALLPSNQAALSAIYREAIRRALRMPQCRLIPFFGVFLRDLYAIVNDMPSVVMIGDEDDNDKLEFMKEQNNDSRYASEIDVSGLLNADKINLVAVVLDNLELFYRHYKNILNFVVDPTEPSTGKENPKPKGYDPVQPIKGVVKTATLVPLDTNHFDLDVIQRLHHGTRVIHCDPDTGRSTLCMLKLDASCGLLLWHKDACIPLMQSAKPLSMTPSENRSLPSSPLRPAEAACTTLDCGFLRLSYVKSIESVASHDIDIESIYRRHSNEEMSVQMYCWTINFGCYLSDNEFLYFIAPEKSAKCWIIGLTSIVNYLLEQQKCADRRVLWLRKLYLQLCTSYGQDSMIDESVISNPQLYKALEAFGGRVEEWKNLDLQNIVSKSLRSETVRSAEVTATKGLKQMTNAVTRRMKFISRNAAQSQSPQSSLKTRYLSVRSRIRDRQCTISDPSTPREILKSYDCSSSTDTSSLSSWYKSRRLSTRALSTFWSGKIKKTKDYEDESLNSVVSNEFSMSSKLYEAKYSQKPVTLLEFVELYKLFNANMRTDLKNIFNDFLVMCGCGNISTIGHERNQKFSQIEPSISDIEFIPNDILTRNTFTTTQYISKKQHQVYNALAQASLNSTSLMDASECSFLTPAMLKQFIEIHQMEIVDDDYAINIIQAHEPDPVLRSKQQLSFEGFVRYMTDSTNYAFMHCGHHILPSKEPIMNFVARWNGSMRRFIIRKKGTDPCSRAWISSIIKGGVGTSPSSSVIQSSACTLSPSHRKANNRCLGQHHVLQRIRSLDPDVFSERKNISDLCPLTHTMSGTFLVCVHNVSKNQPYVILRASINSTADDIIKEVFLKSQQTNVTESEYVLVEEIVKGKSSLLTGALEPSTPGNVILFGEKNVEVAKHFDCKNVSLRVLASNEIVWKAQSAWKTSGRFILENREHTVHSTREKVRNLLQALEDAHISAGSPSPVKR